MPLGTELFKVLGFPHLYNSVAGTDIIYDEIPVETLAERSNEVGEWSYVTLFKLPGSPIGYVKTRHLEPFSQGNENPFPELGPNVFVLHVRRLREEKKGNKRRTVSIYKAYYDGRPLASLEGNILEPRGPGSNARAAINKQRIKQGRYKLKVQGRADNIVTTRYKSYNYRTDYKRPKPGIGVRDSETGYRSAILFHPGDGFLRSTGCLNITSEINDPNSSMDSTDSVFRTNSLITEMKHLLSKNRFPQRTDALIDDAYLIIEGEPKLSRMRRISPYWYSAPEVTISEKSIAQVPYPSDNETVPIIDLDPYEIYDIVLEILTDAKNISDGGLSIFENIVINNKDNLQNIRGENNQSLWHLWSSFWEQTTEIENPSERESREKILLRIAELFRTNGLDINGGDSDITPMIAAAAADEVEAIDAMHKLGADLNHPDHYNRSALHVAGLHGSLRSFRKLIELGANTRRLVGGVDKEWFELNSDKLSKGDYVIEDLPYGSSVITAIKRGEQLSGDEQGKPKFDSMMDLIMGR